jgi:hypothetical protein
MFIYTLDNIELEYESINNMELARRAESQYNVGRMLAFEHVTLMKKTEWQKDTTLINETINVARSSMKAIVMLFTNKTKTDSEEYVYPTLKRSGLPWKVCQLRLKPGYSLSEIRSLYEEARRLFSRREGVGEISHQTLTGFFKDKKFALVIELRTVNDAKTYGGGAKILNTQSGILVEITKKATIANVKYHMFVLSDSLYVEMEHGQLVKVHP